MSTLWTNTFDDPSSFLRNTWHLGPVPKLTSRIGRVVQIAASPCKATPEVWVYAAWVNAPLLIWTLFKPDPIDATYERFGQRRRGKRKYAVYAQGWLSSTEKMPRGPGWALFKLGASLAQKVGWYFIIADATTQFALNWVSTVYQWTGCDFPDAPYAECTAHTGNYGLPAAHTFRYNGWNPGPRFRFFNGPTGIDTPNGFNATCGFNLATGTEPLTGEDTKGWSAELIDAASGAVLDQVKAQPGTNGYHLATAWDSGWSRGSGAKAFRVNITKSAGAFYTTSGNLNAYGGEKEPPGIGPDP